LEKLYLIVDDTEMNVEERGRETVNYLQLNN